jgi:hypothetical protein
VRSNLIERSVLTQTAKAAVVLLAVAILWLALRGWPVQQSISAEQITGDQGAAYFVRLKPWTTSSLLRVETDSAESPEASHLQLTENARVIGPAHSEHDSIRSLGRGRYSHWNEPTVLYFSTSDSSDPRTNGRRYTASTLVRLRYSFTSLAVLLLLGLAFAERNRVRQWEHRTLQATQIAIRSATARAVVATSLAAVLLWSLLAGIPMSQLIAPQRIVHEQGYAYRTMLREWPAPWLLTVPVDSSAAPSDSTARVLEDGKPFGSPHSVHDSIRTEGAGRYSHWSNERALYFSTPDKSDPRVNGRGYAVRVRAEVAPWLWIIALLLVAYSLFSARPLISRASSSLSKAGRRSRPLAPATAAPRRVASALSESARVVLPSVIGTIVALLFVLAVGETYFRLTTPFTEKKWPAQYIEGVGWLFEPNAVVRHTNDLDFWVEDKVNSLGFLDREPTTVDPHKCRIAVIGDSFVEAAQVKNGEKVQALLERRSADTAWPISAAAYGSSGTGQLHQIPFYERYVKATTPNLVVLVFAANDFANNSSVLESVRHGFHPSHPPRMSAIKGSGSADIELQTPDADWHKYVLQLGGEIGTPKCRLCRPHKKLVESSLFYRWVTAKLRLLAPWLLAPVESPPAKPAAIARVEWLARQPQFAGTLGGWKGKPDIDEMFFEAKLPPVFEDALTFTEFAFMEFKRRVEADGGKLVILSASHVRRPHQKNGDLYFERVRTIADTLGIPVLDQHAWLLQHNEPISSVAFRHDNHWNTRGHEVAAEMILEYVASHSSVCTRPSTSQSFNQLNDGVGRVSHQLPYMRTIA